MEELKDYNFYIIGLSGVNINWPLVNLDDSWEEVISGHWKSSNSVMACNLEDNATKVWQPRRCIKITMARTTHKVLSTVSDTSGLGWLFWTHYRGKHNLTLLAITVYRPCITNSRGVQTTYLQHQHYLDRIKYNRFLGVTDRRRVAARSM